RVAPMSGIDYVEDGPHGRRVTAERAPRAVRKERTPEEVQAEAQQRKVKRVRPQTAEEQVAGMRGRAEREQERYEQEQQRLARQKQPDMRPIFTAGNVTRVG